MSEEMKLVLPRDNLCVEEEFMASTGTYVEDGNIYSAVVGRVVYDMNLRRVYVVPSKKVSIPSVGDVVIGQVSGGRDDIVFVKILALNLAMPFKTAFTGLLHISQVSEHRVNSIFEVLRVGDLVKAKVLSSKPPFLLSIKEPRLGVILAYCSKCGAPLVKDNDKLRCPECCNQENRRVSLDYLITRHYKRTR
ncbi:MAG: RNA-binding protein [Thermoprotei archaeon]|nr:MAG: RNA-binding protein [Thermoprotei archaeon]